MQTLATYLFTFVLVAFPPRQNDVHRLREMNAITQDIASTDATADEALTLENIAAMESGFERSAVGRSGARGAFQIMPPARSYDAKEALRRLRAQGIQSYCGCVHACPKTVARRTWPARLFRMAFDPPPALDVRREFATNDD